ncbi:MAG: NADH-quinone oxidoreductase subunit J [Kofleriaceae bacterium]
MTATFYVAGAIALVATFMVVTRTNAVHALLYLIVSLLSVAIIFYQLGAPFVAALEVIIYAGAIMVVFIFVVMMFNLGPASVQQERALLAPAMWVGPGVLAILLAGELVYTLALSPHVEAGFAVITPKQVGQKLFDGYFIGLELASLLLLAGLVGALHLARPRPVANLEGSS